MLNRESVGFKGELYSSEHRRGFYTAHSVAKMEADPKQPTKFRLVIDSLDIADWFRQKHAEIRKSIGFKTPERKNIKGMKM